MFEFVFVFVCVFMYNYVQLQYLSERYITCVVCYLKLVALQKISGGCCSARVLCMCVCVCVCNLTHACLCRNQNRSSEMIWLCWEAVTCSIVW